MSFDIYEDDELQSVNVSSVNNKIQVNAGKPQNYYDGLAKQWAISENIVDSIDYSAKHYAKESKKQADLAIEQATIATNKVDEVVESGNEALEQIIAQETASKNSVKAEGDTQVARVQAEGANYATKAEAKYTAGDGISIENNVISNTQTFAELNNPYTLFDSKYSEAPLYNPSWLNASEGAFHSGAVYVKVYEALLVEQNTEVAVGTTVDLPSGTKYTKRELSVKLSTEDYTEYDFVVNTTDETFRLPLLDGSEDLPGDKYDELTPVSGGIYTAPVNGRYCFNGRDADTAVTKANVALRNYTQRYNGTSGEITNIQPGWLETYLDVKKGDKAGLYYYGTSDISTFKFRFYYAQGNGSLYYYVGETVQNANLIDAGRIGEEMVSNKNLVDCQVVLTTYVNGTSWYRLWSDNWLEQGGFKVGSDGYGLMTVNLLKPYKDASYWLSVKRSGLEDSWFTNTTAPNGAGLTDIDGTVGAMFNDRFTMQKLGNHFWKAEGYIA